MPRQRWQNPRNRSANGNMREVALEVRLILFAIVGMVQESVVIVEDVPLGDGLIVVVGSEFRQCPIGDVLLAVCAVLIVGIEGEGLCFFKEIKGWNHINYQRLKRFVTPYTTDTNYTVFCFCLRCRENRWKLSYPLVHLSGQSKDLIS